MTSSWKTTGAVISRPATDASMPGCWSSISSCSSGRSITATSIGADSGRGSVFRRSAREGHHGGEISIDYGNTESALPPRRDRPERVRRGDLGVPVDAAGGVMTLAEAIAFWIFIIMTVAFFVWVGYLAYKK